MAAVGLATVAYPVTGGKAAAQDDQVLSFTWAGYDIPELYQSYELKNGAPPNYAFYADEY